MMEKWTPIHDGVQLGAHCFVASTNPDYPIGVERQALMSAAPELLKCLEKALRYIEVENAYTGAMTAAEVEEKIRQNRETTTSVAIMANSVTTLAAFSFVNARAAIAKAKGEA